VLLDDGAGLLLAAATPGLAGPLEHAVANTAAAASATASGIADVFGMVFSLDRDRLSAVVTASALDKFLSHLR
jgi:hypothetical protein